MTLRLETAAEPRITPRASISRAMLAVFVTLTTLAIFVPVSPDMPDKGIDQAWIAAIDEGRAKSEDIRQIAKIDLSWVFAINSAVARHLRFGRDIVFTFGPYGSIYTRSFHPATDSLMLFGSCLLGSSFAIALLYLAWERHPYIAIVFLLFCATFTDRDALLLSYPFLLSVCAVNDTRTQKTTLPASRKWWQMLLMGLTLFGLGILPLIKGSLILPAALAFALVIALFVRRRL